MRHLTYLLPALFFANAATAETRLQAGQDLFQSKCIDTLSREAQFDATGLRPVTVEDVVQLNKTMARVSRLLNNHRPIYYVRVTFTHQVHPVLLQVEPKYPPTTCSIAMFDQTHSDIIALWSELSADGRSAKKPEQFSDYRSHTYIFRNSAKALVHLHDKVFLELSLSFGGMGDDMNLTHLHAKRVGTTPVACDLFPEICDQP